MISERDSFAFIRIHSTATSALKPEQISFSSNPQSSIKLFPR